MGFLGRGGACTVLILALSSGCRAASGCRTDVSCDLAAALLFGRVDRYFVYVPVASTLNTQVYGFNADNGALALLSTSGTITSAADPSGKFMYGLVFAAAPNNVRSYRLDTYTGLIDSSSSLNSANNQPAYADFHPNGRFMYVSNNTSLDVSVFSIDQTTGSLTKLGDTATGCACANLAQIKVSPDGRFLYVTHNGGANAIVSFSINQATGALSVTGNVAHAANTDGVVIDPTSNYLYSTAAGAGTVAGFAINQTTGALTGLPGSPYAGTAGNFRMAIHPSGRYIYTVNVAGGQLAKHDIAVNGSLSSPAAVAIGTNLQYVTIEPSGRFGFVNDGVASSYYVFSINQSNGSPSLFATYATGTIPGNIRVVRTNGWL